MDLLRYKKITMESKEAVMDKLKDIDNPYMKVALGLGTAGLVGKHFHDKKKGKGQNQHYPEQAEHLTLGYSVKQNGRK